MEPCARSVLPTARLGGVACQILIGIVSGPPTDESHTNTNTHMFNRETPDARKGYTRQQDRRAFQSQAIILIEKRNALSSYSPRILLCKAPILQLRSEDTRSSSTRLHVGTLAIGSLHCNRHMLDGRRYRIQGTSMPPGLHEAINRLNSHYLLLQANQALRYVPVSFLRPPACGTVA